MSAEEKLSPPERLEHLKKKAEECYARMYDSEPHNLKDWKDDACTHFARAIQVAEELGFEAEKRAIEGRIEHVRAVFNQLRTDGGRTDVAPKDRNRDYSEIWMWLAKWGYLTVLGVAAVAALGYRFMAVARGISAAGELAGQPGLRAFPVPRDRHGGDPQRQSGFLD